jgi:hypothetical protein
MKSHINPDLLPILTETADGTELDLPTLTEAIAAEQLASALALTDAQCRQLAAQLFPRLEATLRDAIGSRSEARWEKAMERVRNVLPDLISLAAEDPR